MIEREKIKVRIFSLFSWVKFLNDKNPYELMKGNRMKLKLETNLRLID